MRADKQSDKNKLNYLANKGTPASCRQTRRKKRGRVKRFEHCRVHCRQDARVPFVKHIFVCTPIFNFFLLLVANFICVLLLAFSVESQEIPQSQNFHQWGAVTLFNGLPSDNVRAIAQTPDGVLWFGTDNGLTKFDGRRVSTVTIDDAGKIFTLEITPDGTLWVGAEKGAFFFDGGKFRLVEETKNIVVTAILASGKIFLATGEGIIFAVARNEKTGTLAVERIPSEPLRGSDGLPLNITSLAQSGGKIIAGTRSRSILLIENNQTFETFSRPFFVNALAQDAQGNVWLGADSRGTGSGFFSLDDLSRPVQIDAESGNVLAIEPDGANGVWVGTETSGLFRFRGERQIERFTFENTSGGLRSNTIYTLFTDREGVIWIGTNRGVCRFDASSPFNQTLSEDRNGNFVRTLFRSSDGRIFAATNRGLFLFSGGIWLETEHFSKTIYTVGEDSAKQLLIGTPNALFSFDGKEKFKGDVRAVANFRGKTYAAIFEQGIVQIENQSQFLAVESPTTLFADGEKLWIGTAEKGVFPFDGKEIKQEKPLESLQGAAIRKITKDAENNLWFSGERGLFRYQNGELQTIIPNEDVRDFAIIGADIWAATLKGGLFHVRFDENFGWLISDLNVEQGLPSEQIFALLPIENRLLIGTNRGVVNYSPGAVAPKIVASRVLSQRLHSAEELSGTINLDYPQNSILVEVAGLSSRTFPEQFQYGFLLKNSNGDVLEKKLSNNAQFTPANLPAGEYSIQILAFNKDLLASEPLIIKFSVARAPFPWTATALGVLLVIALIALVWAIIERRRIAQKNRELAAARFDLANEAERERKRIAQDLHDQTLADLRNLMLMSDKLPSDNSEFRSEIESVSTEIRRICEDLSPSVLENVGLTAALEFLLSHTIEEYKFSAADSEETFNFSPNVQMQIYRIAQEVLTNIKSHSDAKFVEMKIDVSEENEFVLSIEDDGSFFSPTDNSPRGRGIANIKSRAALVKAEIVWQKGAGGGTRFLLHKRSELRLQP